MNNKMDKELKKNMVIGVIAGISGALAGIILGSKLSRDYNITILSNSAETESLDEDNID